MENTEFMSTSTKESHTTRYPRGTLLFDAFPHLLKELAYAENEHLSFDIATLSYASHKQIYWKCPKNIHPAYPAAIHNKTRIEPTSCPMCSHDLTRKYDKNTQQESVKEWQLQKTNINTLKGDQTELYVMNLLQKSNSFLAVQRIGQTGDKADLIITLFSGIQKGLQIKTLIEDKTIHNRFYINMNTYPPDMLIVMVNNERTKFALEFQKNIHSKRLLALNFNNNKSPHQSIMYQNEDQFIKKLCELIPLSVEYTEAVLSESGKKEAESFQRFSERLKKAGSSFQRNETNSDSIDGFINNILPVQLKYISTNCVSALTYQMKLQHTICRNNIIAHQPRSIDEIKFEYIIIEIGGIRGDPNPTKWHGWFCVIPTSELVNQGVLKTETQKGKTSLMVCPPDYKKKHWTMKYWVGPDGTFPQSFSPNHTTNSSAM